MITFGSFTLIMAFLSGLVSLGLFISNIIFGGKVAAYVNLARRFAILQLVFTTLSVFILLRALIVSDFSYHYVASYSSTTLPFLYKLSGLWAGQAGSLLFWGWLASVFLGVEILRSKQLPVNYQSYLFIIPVLTTLFFTYISGFITPVFETLDFLPQEGRGMNPMLQNPGMLIHPPMLYLGFVGFLIPFSHAYAALATREKGAQWVRLSRPWLIISWVFLTGGIVLGGWWAYVELGWGGYWAWDPVENASLFPWMTATAFIHAVILYQKRDKLKGWTYALIFITFELTIFGTYLTRSGIMTDSVHSFALSNLGNYFLFFILVTSVLYLFYFYKSKFISSDDEEFNFFSKEGIFFMGVLSISALTVALIFYTMLPVITELLLNRKQTVQNNSYNIVSIVFFSIIFLLAGASPFISYSKGEIREFKKGYLPVAIVCLFITLVAFILGYRKPVALFLTYAALTVGVSFLFHTIRTIRSSGFKILYLNKRLTGSFLAHFGVSMMALGIIYSGFYSRSIEITVMSNSDIHFEAYTLSIGEINFEEGPNYKSSFVPVHVTKNGKDLFNLYPELRSYDNNENIYGEVSYYSMLKGDLYTILQGYDMQRDIIKLSIIFQPLIIWLWIGCITMCIGGIVTAAQKL